MEHVVYAGCIIDVVKEHSFRAVIMHQKKKYAKSYSYKTVRTKQSAEQLAQSWRQLQSDQLGLTIRRSLSTPPVEVRQYIAGLIDSDGCISLESTYLDYRVYIAQSCDSGVPEIFQHIQQVYYCHVKVNANAHGNHRKKWVLSFYSDWAITLLKDIFWYLQLKRSLAAVVLGVYTLKRDNQYDTSKTNQHLHMVVKMRTQSWYRSLNFDNENVSTPYVAGFFDGDGSVYMSFNTRHNVFARGLVFTQLSSTSLLEAVNRWAGNTGHIHGKHLQFSTSNGFRVATTLAPYSCIKYEQIQLLLSTVSDGVRTKRSQSEIARLTNIVTCMKRMKRT
jgi:hypothetical protein